MEYNIFEKMQLVKKQEETALLVRLNERTEQFDLALTPEEAGQLVVSRNDSLRKYGRVEFGKGILDKLIDKFCDSQYVRRDGYLETLKKLQDIFYEFKNSTEDRMTDDELMNFMREQFDKVCFGDLEYLESTCLERYAAAVRSGHRGYEKSDGYGEYEQFDEEERWDAQLYHDVLKELFWR